MDVALKDFAKPLAAKDRFIKMAIGGFAGSGKTRTGTEFIIGCYEKMKIKKPLLILDNEKGGRFLIPLFEQAGVKSFAKNTTSLADVHTAFDLLNKNDIGFLFIDTISKIWYQYVRDYRSKNRKTFMTLQDWGKILPAWQEQFSDRFVALNGNCVFTGRGGYEYEKEEDEVEDGKVVSKGQFVKSGVKMKVAGETSFEPDVNVWMSSVQQLDSAGGLKVFRQAQILKDRSGLIDGHVFINPTFKEFEPVIDFLLGVKTGQVLDETSKQNLAPAEDWSKQNAMQEKTILLEKIKDMFVAQSFTTSQADKKLKISILVNYFGTSSKTEIDSLPVAQLQNGYTGLTKLFKAWDGNVDRQKFYEEWITKEQEEPDNLKLWTPEEEQ